MLLQVFPTVPPHEGEIQRPPGEADHGNVNQLAFDQKLQKRYFAVEQVLQYEDIDPALMIRVYKIPVFVLQTIEALYVPTGFLSHSHPAAVAGYPVGCHPVKDTVDMYPYRFEWQQQFEKGKKEDDDAPE
jgi:hypothetical protein